MPICLYAPCAHQTYWHNFYNNTHQNNIIYDKRTDCRCATEGHLHRPARGQAPRGVPKGRAHGAILGGQRLSGQSPQAHARTERLFCECRIRTGCFPALPRPRGAIQFFREISLAPRRRQAQRRHDQSLRTARTRQRRKHSEHTEARTGNPCANRQRADQHQGAAPHGRDIICRPLPRTYSLRRKDFSLHQNQERRRARTPQAARAEHQAQGIRRDYTHRGRRQARGRTRHGTAHSRGALE